MSVFKNKTSQWLLCQNQKQTTTDPNGQRCPTLFFSRAWVLLLLCWLLISKLFKTIAFHGSVQPLHNFNKTWVGYFEEQGRLWTAFGFLCLEVLQNHITLGGRDLLLLSLRKYIQNFQVSKLNILCHCLDRFCRASKNFTSPWFWSPGQLSGIGREWLSHCNVYLFLPSYQNITKSNLVSGSNATLSQIWLECLMMFIKRQPFTTFKLHNYTGWEMLLEWV